jgi:hypothetical protein
MMFHRHYVRTATFSCRLALGIGERAKSPKEFRQNDDDKTTPGAGYFELREGAVSEVPLLEGREHFIGGPS